MEKRPISMTIIAVVIIVFTLLGIAAWDRPVASQDAGTNAMSLAIEQAWGGLGSSSISCAPMES